MQGGVDFAVFPFLTDAVVQSLRDNGATQLTYLTYPDQDHNGVVEASLPDVEQWVDARLAEHPVTTTTTSTTVPPSTTTTPATTTGASVIAVTATSPTTDRGHRDPAGHRDRGERAVGRDDRRAGPASNRLFLRVAHQAAPDTASGRRANHRT